MVLGWKWVFCYSCYVLSDRRENWYFSNQYVSFDIIPIIRFQNIPYVTKVVSEVFIMKVFIDKFIPFCFSWRQKIIYVYAKMIITWFIKSSIHHPRYTLSKVLQLQSSYFVYMRYSEFWIVRNAILVYFLYTHTYVTYVIRVPSSSSPRTVRFTDVKIFSFFCCSFMTFLIHAGNFLMIDGTKTYRH